MERPDYEGIRRTILQEYNKATDSSLEEDIKSNDDRLIDVVGWLNTALSSGALSFIRQEAVLVAAFSPELAAKTSILAQFHCPLCKGGKGLISNFSLRFSPMSYQNKNSKLRAAYKRAIRMATSKSRIPSYGNLRLCVHVIFIISKKRNTIDVDNMAKLFLDGLQGAMFENDHQIDHLNLHKLTWEGDEEHIQTNIRESKYNLHEDVLYHKFLHSWGGAEELRLEDFIEP